MPGIGQQRHVVAARQVLIGTAQVHYADILRDGLGRLSLQILIGRANG
jgi:hypothetical protein